MRSDVAKTELLEEFPDLQNGETILQKEIFAHFGLLFMKFGLVEHSMINIFVFSTVGEANKQKRISSREQWEGTFDGAYATAVALTFGNLTKKVLPIAEFMDLSAEFEEAKRVRNYFAHHFMRDESALFGSDDGCWLLLQKIAAVRHQTIALEETLKPRFSSMCSRFGIRLPTEAESDDAVDVLRNESHAAVRAGTIKMGWEL